MFAVKVKNVALVLMLSAALAPQGMTQTENNTSFIDIFSLPTPYCFKGYCAPNDRNFWTVGGATVLYGRGDGTLRKSELPDDLNIYGVHFRASGKGWLVGADGVIYHTTDNGSSWVRQQSEVTKESLEAISCVDDRRCWVVGQDGSVLSTSDAGCHWRKLTNIPTIEAGLKDVAFVDRQTGWLAADDGVILHTIDGGASWDTSRAIIDPKTSANIETIKFVNRKIGWAAGWWGITQTTDGGKTWRPVLQESDSTGQLHFIGLVTQNAGRKLWAVGDRNTPNYCSVNGGRTWQPCGLKRNNIKPDGSPASRTD